LQYDLTAETIIRKIKKLEFKLDIIIIN